MALFRCGGGDEAITEVVMAFQRNDTSEGTVTATIADGLDSYKYIMVNGYTAFSNNPRQTGSGGIMTIEEFKTTPFSFNRTDAQTLSITATYVDNNTITLVNGSNLFAPIVYLFK